MVESKVARQWDHTATLAALIVNSNPYATNKVNISQFHPYTPGPGSPAPGNNHPGNNPAPGSSNPNEQRIMAKDLSILEKVFCPGSPPRK